MEKTPILKLLLKLSLPVMFALLIQSAYNIVDSYFVSKYSSEGFTALAIIFPVQLLMTTLSTGTGTGLNILISRMDGNRDTTHQNDTVISGLFLGLLNYLVFAAVGMLFLNRYFKMLSENIAVQTQGIIYARIVFLWSFGLFAEANCTKLLQAKGNMFVPMVAQVVGAIINIVLDPILIFGLSGVPELGIAGAAIASIGGQIAAMGITLRAVCKIYAFKGKIHLRRCVEIYKNGLPSIVMQSLYTLYIVGLNLILKQFTEDAVTVLGIYYKLQTFFFIPLMGLQQVIVPIISFNYGAKNEERVKKTLVYSIGISSGVMCIATIVFMAFPKALTSIFSSSEAIHYISTVALRLISISFIPAGFVMMFTVYFQGIDCGKSSIFITVLRQVILLVPLAWVFHFAGLNYVWLTFPVTELVAMLSCFAIFRIRKKRGEQTEMY
ncbi:MAG: MATE family efflux transporter [Monoglobaceae bacterium]